MRPIYLVGFSGTGKSTVGRLLGARLGRPACDLDTLIVERTGRTIADVFANDGEPAFRQIEAETLRAAARRDDGPIVATGGGVPTFPANRDTMAASGWIVCLEASPETLYRRLKDTAEVRPLLQAADPLEHIRALKATRQPAYALAHWTVHTDHLTPEQVAEEIARAVALLERGATAPPAAGFPVGAKWFGRDRPVVCVPIVAATPGEAVAQAARIAPLAPDAVELRADYLRDISPGLVGDLLPRLAAYGMPILFTNRRRPEGGAQEQDETARVAAIEAAIASGIPAIADVELATPAEYRDRLVAAGRAHGVPILLSFHDFAATPPDGVLVAHLRAMQAAGASAAKLALLPQAAADATRLLALCRAATAGAIEGFSLPLAAMSMGPVGMITRVVGHQAGSALTFAAVAPGGGSAPGQLSIGELRACWAAIGAREGAGGPGAEAPG
jgi:3-dehydroquinate dehydratase-1